MHVMKSMYVSMYYSGSVLNMDHHCPWINNCVGFYNRKFFMQLLFYVYVCLLFVGIGGYVE